MAGISGEQNGGGQNGIVPQPVESRSESDSTEESSFEGSLTLPVRVEVRRLVNSRYADNVRPLSWDNRTAGRDVIEATDGTMLTLLSDGQQSPPKPGWVILLIAGSEVEGYKWTLYGIKTVDA